MARHAVASTYSPFQQQHTSETEFTETKSMHEAEILFLKDPQLKCIQIKVNEDENNKKKPYQ